MINFYFYNIFFFIVNFNIIFLHKYDYDIEETRDAFIEYKDTVANEISKKKFFEYYEKCMEDAFPTQDDQKEDFTLRGKYKIEGNEKSIFEYLGSINTDSGNKS